MIKACVLAPSVYGRTPSRENIVSVSNETNRPFRKSLAAILSSLLHDFFADYRPERHYMRGPGPKWRTKHAMKSVSAAFSLNKIAISL